MRDLVVGPPPRPTATVELLTSAAVQRTKRMANKLGLIFFVVAGVATAIACIAELTDPSPWGDMVFIIPSLFVFTGPIPAFAIRRILLRDVRGLVRVAREGAVYEPIAGGDRLDLYGGMTSLSLVWEEDGRQALAQFDVFKPDLQPVLAKDVRVLARPRDRYVLAVLGNNGVFVGLRRRYVGSVVNAG